MEPRSHASRTIFGNILQDGMNVRKAGAAKPVAERQETDRRETGERREGDGRETGERRRETGERRERDARETGPGLSSCHPSPAVTGPD